MNKKSYAGQIAAAIILSLVALFVWSVPTLRAWVWASPNVRSQFLIDNYGLPVSIFLGAVLFNIGACTIAAKSAPMFRLGRRLQHLTGPQLSDASLSRELSEKLKGARANG